MFTVVHPVAYAALPTVFYMIECALVEGSIRIAESFGLL